MKATNTFLSAALILFTLPACQDLGSVQLTLAAKDSSEPDQGKQEVSSPGSSSSLGSVVSPSPSPTYTASPSPSPSPSSSTSPSPEFANISSHDKLWIRQPLKILADSNGQLVFQNGKVISIHSIDVSLPFCELDYNSFADPSALAMPGIAFEKDSELTIASLQDDFSKYSKNMRERDVKNGLWIESRISITGDPLANFLTCAVPADRAPNTVVAISDFKNSVGNLVTIETRDQALEFSKIAAGSTIALNQPVPIRKGYQQVFLQGGQVVDAIALGSPFCELHFGPDPLLKYSARVLQAGLTFKTSASGKVTPVANGKWIESELDFEDSSPRLFDIYCSEMAGAARRVSVATFKKAVGDVLSLYPAGEFEFGLLPAGTRFLVTAQLPVIAKGSAQIWLQNGAFVTLPQNTSTKDPLCEINISSLTNYEAPLFLSAGDVLTISSSQQDEDKYGGFNLRELNVINGLTTESRVGLASPSNGNWITCSKFSEPGKSNKVMYSDFLKAVGGLVKAQ